MLDASMAPSAPPAPINVCSSSTNNITFPACVTSVISFLILSSNSPRYFEPATIPERSKDNSRLSSTVSGTSPAMIICARPSTIAVLPTPGSPTKQGLFFIRLLKICTTRCISVFLPTTGSSFPSLANCVKSLEYWSNVGVLDLPFLSFDFKAFISAFTIAGSKLIAAKISPNSLETAMFIAVSNRNATLSGCLTIAINKCSVPTCCALNLIASLSASAKISWHLFENSALLANATFV